MISIVTDSRVEYPQPDEHFSPSTAYPEYAHGHVAKTENRVYPMVRETLAQLGLDRSNYGTPAWNPLGPFIDRGSSVFVLCNFVHHRRSNESPRDFLSKCTHGSVLRAVLDYVLLAVGPQGSVRFGNAPLQSCDWGRVLKHTGAAAVAEFYRRAGAPVQARDLRLLVVDTDGLGRRTVAEQRDDSGAVEVDLADDSLLEAHYQTELAPHYRVLDYDPRRTERCHSRGRHVYLINRAILDSDVVFSVPKLKTHQKVGITVALKGFVGTVGHKDCLAHHRFGGSRVGGDEYPGNGRLRLMASRFHDWVYGGGSELAVSGVLQVADRSLRRLIGRSGGVPGGGWSGNDTAWRMSLDLGRIVFHADQEGRLQERPQRRHLCLVDGIVGGEGNGPLRPSAVDSRVLCFSDDVVAADRTACRLMGIDPGWVPLVHEADGLQRFKVRPAEPVEDTVMLNGETTREDAIAPALSRPFRLPLGWRSLQEVGA